jgi:hypothetical protein
MPKNEARQKFLKLLDELDAKYNEVREPLYAQTPAVGYWLSMLAGLAVKRSNSIVDQNPKYASADHGANFQCLLRAMRQSIQEKEHFEGPFFDGVLIEDPRAETVLLYESARTQIRHKRASVVNELWEIEEPSEKKFRIHLAKKHQRTALHILSVKAQFLNSSKAVKSILSKTMKSQHDQKDAVKLTLALQFVELDALTKGVGPEWQQFLKSISVTEHSLVHFQALLSEINNNTNRLWFREETLIELMEEFEKQQGLPRTSRGCAISMIQSCSPSLDDAITWGLSLPFVRFGEWYLRWPFVFHVLHPNLTTLAILMKRAPEAWNNTVGSHSAKVATYLASKLYVSAELKITTCKIKKGVGDIDLGVLNIESGDILLCEVKTVFDRFRTNHQISNFAEQRVNYSKAVQQLRATENAIESGAWKVPDIFGSNRERPPTARILKIVLTWWDIFDPFKGTCDADVATCNFNTFIYLFNEAKGDLWSVYTSLLELSSLPCPASPRQDYVAIDDFRFDYAVDVQTDALPPKSDPRRAALSPLSVTVIQDIASFPENWREKVLASGEDPDNWVFE